MHNDDSGYLAGGESDNLGSRGNPENDNEAMVDAESHITAYFGTGEIEIANSQLAAPKPIQPQKMDEQQDKLKISIRKSDYDNASDMFLFCSPFFAMDQAQFQNQAIFHKPPTFLYDLRDKFYAFFGTQERLRIRYEQMVKTFHEIRELLPTQDSCYCSICAQNFQDYHTHIKLISHQKKFHVSRSHRYLKKLIYYYNNAIKKRNTGEQQERDLQQQQYEEQYEQQQQQFRGREDEDEDEYEEGNRGAGQGSRQEQQSEGESQGRRKKDKNKKSKKSKKDKKNKKDKKTKDKKKMKNQKKKKKDKYNQSQKQQDNSGENQCEVYQKKVEQRSESIWQRISREQELRGFNRYKYNEDDVKEQEQDNDLQSEFSDPGSRKWRPMNRIIGQSQVKEQENYDSQVLALQVPAQEIMNQEDRSYSGQRYESPIYPVDEVWNQRYERYERQKKERQSQFAKRISRLNKMQAHSNFSSPERRQPNNFQGFREFKMSLNQEQQADNYYCHLVQIYQKDGYIGTQKAEKIQRPRRPPVKRDQIRSAPQVRNLLLVQNYEKRVLYRRAPKQQKQKEQENVQQNEQKSQPQQILKKQQQENEEQNQPQNQQKNQAQPKPLYKRNQINQVSQRQPRPQRTKKPKPPSPEAPIPKKNKQIQKNPKKQQARQTNPPTRNQTRKNTKKQEESLVPPPPNQNQNKETVKNPKKEEEKKVTETTHKYGLRDRSHRRRYGDEQ